MKLQSFTRLLAASTAVFFAGAANAHTYGHHYSHTYSQPPQSAPCSSSSTTVEPTTTFTSTAVLTATETATVVETKTREIPCPPSETGVLNFDNLNTTGVSPMPLVYQDFTFSGSAGWQYFNYAAFPPNSSEYRSVNSRPNALLSRSYGLVSFGSQGRNFSFDITSVSFFAFTPTYSPNSTLLLEVGLIMADEYTETLFFTVENSALNATGPVVFGEDEFGEFKDLVSVSVAVWQSYDNITGEGNPADFVLDDIQYVKRRCSNGTSY